MPADVTGRLLSSVIPVSCTGLVDVNYCHSSNCTQLCYSENKVDIMHLYVYGGLNYVVNIGR